MKELLEPTLAQAGTKLRKAHPQYSFHLWPWRMTYKEQAPRARNQGHSVDKGVPPRGQNWDLFKELSLLPGKGAFKILAQEGFIIALNQ